MPREAVGQDVARAQQREDLVQVRRSYPDVDHQRQLDLIGQLPGQAQRFETDPAGRLHIDPGLDAQDGVAVGLHDLARQIEVAVVEVGQLVGGRDEPDRRDVQEREDARLAPFDHMATEARKAVAARRPGVEPSGDPRARRDRIRLDSPVCGAPVDVRVQIEQAGRHHQPRGVQRRSDPLAGKGAVHRGDDAAPDPDVHPPQQPAAGVHHLAALDDQIKVHGLSSPRLTSFRAQPGHPAQRRRPVAGAAAVRALATAGATPCRP